MPGSGVCGRCGTSLALGADVGVLPPRAGSRTLALRRWTGCHTWGRQARDAFATVIALVRNDRVALRQRLGLGAQLSAIVESMRSRGEGLPETVGTHEVLLRAIVPGWPQWFVGQRWQGALFLIAYVAFAVPGVLDLLRGGPGWTLGIAFAIHAAGVVDLVQQAWHNDTFLVRFARGLVTALVMIAVIYGVPTWLLATYASPSRIGYTAGTTFATGDVVLINARGHADVGDVVVFQTGLVEYANERGGARRYAYDGAIIDRVLAGPGDRVACARGVLTINGRPARRFPVNPTYRIPDFAEVLVPANAVFILPSNVPPRFAAGVGQAVVQREQVTGIVWYRVSPWARAGSVH